MRLVNQKGAGRKGGHVAQTHHGRNQNHSLITGMVPHPGPQGGAKNAWQSIDASSIQNDQNMTNQGLMIQPCSNQAQNLISGPAAMIDIARPSVTQGGSSPGTAVGGQRSPRTSGNIKNQFYGVHGRGMNI